MAVTWDEVRQKVRGDLWRNMSGLPDDQCDRAIHSSLLELEGWGGRRWLWLENIRLSDAISEATTSIALPSDLRSVSSISLKRPGASSFDPALAVLPLAVVRESASYHDARWPAAYARSGDSAWLDGTALPGSVFEIVYSARTPRELSVAVAAGMTFAGNRTLDAFQTIVIAGAAAFAAQTYLKDDANFARQRATFERLVEMLEAEDDEARSDVGGGKIIPYSFGCEGRA